MRTLDSISNLKSSWACKLLWPLHTWPGNNLWALTLPDKVRNFLHVRRWTEEGLSGAKRVIGPSETLGYLNKDAPTPVIADASPVELGAVLTQKQKNGSRVICYASYSLTDTKRRYSQTEKEALVLVGPSKSSILMWWCAIWSCYRSQATGSCLWPKVKSLCTHWKMGGMNAAIQIQGQVWAWAE